MGGHGVVADLGQIEHAAQVDPAGHAPTGRDDRFLKNLVVTLGKASSSRIADAEVEPAVSDAALGFTDEIKLASASIGDGHDRGDGLMGEVLAAVHFDFDGDLGEPERGGQSQEAEDK